MADAEADRARERQAARARTFVVNSLGARAQSVAEIEAKLLAREVPAEIAEKVVTEALRLGYLDDGELAGQLARGYRSRGYGQRRASLGLRRRRIGSAEADAALVEAFGSSDEGELASAALGSRPVGDEREQRRAVAFLVRRGFSGSVAWQVVRSRGAADD